MPEDFDRRRILVVDDEERMVRFIRMNLEHDGFQVAEAFNGRQAIQKLRDVTPELILLDVMMPDIDGFEVLDTIREASNVPVIMLTAKGVTIGHLAQVPTILMCYSDRVLSLFWEATPIHDHDRIRLSQPLCHQRLQMDHRWSAIPTAFAHKALQITDGMWERTQQEQYHRLDRLALQV